MQEAVYIIRDRWSEVFIDINDIKGREKNYYPHK